MPTHRRLPILCLLVVVLVQLACTGVTPITPRSAPPASVPTTPALEVTSAPAATEAPGSTEAPPEGGATPEPVPNLTPLYISPTGDDANDGATRDHPLKTLGEAWRRIPEGTLIGTGYSLRLLPGTYPCEGDCNNYFDNRSGTETYPIYLEAADGPGTVTLLGGLNLAGVRYLHVVNLTLRAGGADPMWGNNVLHLEGSDHVWFTGLTVSGPNHAQNPDNYDIQEVIKVNQSDYVTIALSDISGTYQTGVDFFAVQHGTVMANRVHGTGEWGMYFKGGSANLRIEGNELYDCGLGIQAGEGSNLEVMRPPYLHYEVYEAKIVNNILHDIPGVGLSVAGGYNVLLAYNTLYKVGYFTGDGERSYALALFTHGGRGCIETAEKGENQGNAICGGYVQQGGWGPATVQDGGEWIPNRNVFVYNNLFYNPAGVQTHAGHFGAQAPADLPAAAKNIPSPSRVDDNLVIRGNVIWNGPADMSLGLDEEGSCQPNHPTCSAERVRAENTINTLEPQLVDPEYGDFRPTLGGNLTNALGQPIPDFTWDDAPTKPPIPPGDLSNQIPYDFSSAARHEPWPGALTGRGAPATTDAPVETAVPLPTLPPAPTAPQEVPTASGAPQAIGPGALAIVALGDSLTEGDGDELRRGGYPGRLLELVKAVRPGATLTNLGRSGWSSDALINGDQGQPGQLGLAEDALRQAVAAGRPAVALVWIGSNDLFYLYEYGEGSDQGDTEDLARYTANLDTILSRLRGAGASVVIALLDDQSKRPVTQKGEAFTNITRDEIARMSRQVERYNQAIAEKAAQYGAGTVDFYHTDIFTNPATLYSDGNHPNPAGYDLIAQKWFEALLLTP
jgi:lysophospholipase L1-like esterase